jgi:hypothetical protein
VLSRLLSSTRLWVVLSNNFSNSRTVLDQRLIDRKLEGKLVLTGLQSFNSFQHLGNGKAEALGNVPDVQVANSKVHKPISISLSLTISLIYKVLFPKGV